MHIDNNNFDQAVKVIQYNIISKIKYFWGTYESFKTDWDYQISHKDNRATSIFGRIWGAFHIDKKILRNIVGRSSTKSNVQEFLAYIAESKDLRHINKISKYYKSGKSFQSKSFFYIPFETLDMMMQEIESILDVSKYDQKIQKKIRKYIMQGVDSKTYDENKSQSKPDRPENDVDMGDEIDENLKTDLKNDVKLCLVSVEFANRISIRLGLGLTFGHSDQRYGMSVTNESIKCANKWTEIIKGKRYEEKKL